jgi:lysophospholipase L1-like esterase
MRHTRRSKRGLILSLLSLVALVAALTLSVGLQQYASQVHAAGAGVASDGPSFHLFGPEQHYLALGDSLAYGLQPNCSTTCTHGYVNDLFPILQSEGTKDVTNLGCPGETSTSFIGGGKCPYPTQTPSQLETAVAFLKTHPGKVSPVTLDIGSNDMLPDLIGCTVSSTFDTDLATLDNNLTKFILPQLQAALTVNGRVTGSIVMMNYYNPFPNCAASAQFTQAFNEFNTHLATDVGPFGFIVDVFGAFGGITTPNICTYTWICAVKDIHPTDLGYTVIANTFAAAIPPD